MAATLFDIIEAAGHIRQVRGTVHAADALGSERPLRVGDPVHEGDTLRTAEASGVSVEFLNGGRLDLGSMCQVKLASEVIGSDDPALEVDDYRTSYPSFLQAILQGNPLDPSIDTYSLTPPPAAPALDSINPAQVVEETEPTPPPEPIELPIAPACYERAFVTLEGDRRVEPGQDANFRIKLVDADGAPLAAPADGILSVDLRYQAADRITRTKVAIIAGNNQIAFSISPSDEVYDEDCTHFNVTITGLRQSKGLIEVLALGECHSLDTWILHPGVNPAPSESESTAPDIPSAPEVPDSVTPEPPAVEQPPETESLLLAGRLQEKGLTLSLVPGSATIDAFPHLALDTTAIAARPMPRRTARETHSLPRSPALTLDNGLFQDILLPAGPDLEPQGPVLMAQDIPSKAGVDYELSFFYRPRTGSEGSSSSAVTLFWEEREVLTIDGHFLADDILQCAITDSEGASRHFNASSWAEVSTTLTATVSGGHIEFRSCRDPDSDGPCIDNITLMGSTAHYSSPFLSPPSLHDLDTFWDTSRIQMRHLADPAIDWLAAGGTLTGRISGRRMIEIRTDPRNRALRLCQMGELPVAVGHATILLGIGYLLANQEGSPSHGELTLAITDTRSPVLAVIEEEMSAPEEGWQAAYLVKLVDAHGDPVNVPVGESITLELAYADASGWLESPSGYPSQVSIEANQSSVGFSVDTANGTRDWISVSLAGLHQSHASFDNLHIDQLRGTLTTAVPASGDPIPEISAYPDGSEGLPLGHTLDLPPQGEASPPAIDGAGMLRLTGNTRMHLSTDEVLDLTDGRSTLVIKGDGSNRVDISGMAKADASDQEGYELYIGGEGENRVTLYLDIDIDGNVI